MASNNQSIPGNRSEAILSLSFLLSLQGFISFLLAYLIIYTYSQHPTEPQSWLLARFSLVVSSMVLLAWQSLS